MQIDPSLPRDVSWRAVLIWALFKTYVSLQGSICSVNAVIMWVTAFKVININKMDPGWCTQWQNLIYMQGQSWLHECCSIIHNLLPSVHPCCHVSRSLSILKRPRWRSAVCMYCCVKHQRRHIPLNKPNTISAAVGNRASANLWKPTR